MDKGYEVFCLVDALFYDSPLRPREGSVDFEAARAPAPDGWQRAEMDDWLMCWPEQVDLPSQGWKIHASTCLDNAEEVLRGICDYCIPRRIPFKFIRNRDLLFLRNLKYAHRGLSGKFATIFPRDEAQLEVILTELGSALEGQPGPYILSDLRWGSGPLYVRYGAFADRWCFAPNGDLVPAIEDGEGRLVPDDRGPTFEIPPWVTLPECLAPHLAARNSATVAELPYEIEAALHFSNAGGLYSAVDKRSGEKVVLKEARPYAGLSLDGAHAVTRLEREREMLACLAGLDVVPAVRDFFVLGEHHFLVMDFVEGTSLMSLLVERNPITSPEISDAAAAAYTAWVIDVLGRVERAVAAVHARDIVIGDLHPSNVLVGPDGSVTLIDLEAAWHVSEERTQVLADAAFIAPGGARGFEIDRYALAVMRLAMFLPLTPLIARDVGKAPALARAIEEMFPVPPGFLDDAVEVITAATGTNGAHANGSHRPRPGLDPDPRTWERVRDSMSRAILASATPERDDRLFPGDPKQFATGALNLAYGAAGVLYALAATGAGRHPELEGWLVQRATAPEPGTRVGFYEGLHGVAHALDFLGRRDDAAAVLDICIGEFADKVEHLGLDLYGGLSGIALNLADLADAWSDASLWDAAQHVAEMVASRLGDESSVATISGGDHPYAGLLRGSSGPALLFVRLYEQTGDTSYLDLAATALRQDLRRCTVREDGVMEVNEGWRTMPYVADGSVGIGLVLDDYLRHRGDEQFAQARAGIRRAAQGCFFIEPGLFWGRAGMILYLSRARRAGERGLDAAVAAHARRLDWHALTYQGELAFPGEYLLRLSMDLATGTAGVLLALASAFEPEPVSLPFLDRLGEDRHQAGRQPATTAERR